MKFKGVHVQHMFRAFILTLIFQALLFCTSVAVRIETIKDERLITNCGKIIIVYIYVRWRRSEEKYMWGILGLVS